MADPLCRYCGGTREEHEIKMRGRIYKHHFSPKETNEYILRRIEEELRCKCDYLTSGDVDKHRVNPDCPEHGANRGEEP